MINIPLQAIPNQSLSIQLDGNNYDIRLFSCDNTPTVLGTSFMVVTIYRNSILIVENFRAIPSSPIIPYVYLQNGNFIIITENDEYPNYNFFGVNQFLIYASPAELEAIANGTFVP